MSFFNKNLKSLFGILMKKGSLSPSFVFIWIRSSSLALEKFSFSIIFLPFVGMTGIVDYAHYDDMKYAIKKLDDTEFRNAFSRSYIRVCHNVLDVLNSGFALFILLFLVYLLCLGERV
jgi:hypothetical protein